MIRKMLIPASLVSVFALSGCFQTIHGGGSVTLYDVQNGQPGTANVGVSFICNDKSNKISGTLAWNDQTNGVQFTARLPWTPIAEVSDDSFNTCAEAEAASNSLGVSFNLALINTQGQQSGIAGIAVGYPGVDPTNCGDLSPIGVVAGTDDQNVNYTALGCLDRGNIVFQ